VIKHGDSLENTPIVTGGTTEISVQGCKVDGRSEPDDHAMDIGTTSTGFGTGLVVEVDVDANFTILDLLVGPGKTLTVEDPALSQSLLDGLAVPDLLDETTLLLVVTDHDRVLINRLGGKTSDRECVQLDVDISAQLGSSRATLEGMAGAASIAPHSGTNIDVLDVVGDALKDLRSRANRSGITVAVEAGKGEVGSRLGRRWGTTRLALALGVALGRAAEHCG